MPDRPNPLEQLVTDFADHYVSMVENSAAAIAPFRPWWSVTLKPDEEVFRYQQIREPIVTWLSDISPYMGWDSLEAAMTAGELRRLFTGPELDTLVPVELRVDERADGLKELVQAAGPYEASRHLARVEAMVRRRVAASATLAAARPSQLPGEYGDMAPE